jgi:hypothetical protein
MWPSKIDALALGLGVAESASCLWMIPIGGIGGDYGREVVNVKRIWTGLMPFSTSISNEEGVGIGLPKPS